MEELDDLERRVNDLISGLSEIIQELESDIADSKKAGAFNQVKEIENSITRMQKQGIPVPSELSALKIKLVTEHDRHQARIALNRKIQESIRGLLSRNISAPTRKAVVRPEPDGQGRRKPFEYEKPLGSKGNSNLDDYLIPVIRLMWNGGSHTEAFHETAKKLDVRYNTVSSQCTRALDITTEEFIRQVNSKSIVNLLVRKYPDQYQRIKSELKT